MSCDNHEDMLSRYHDGELPEVDRARLEEHLRVCPACTVHLGRLRALSRMFDTLELPKVEPQLLDRLHAVLPARQREAVILHLVREAAVAASVILVLSVSVLAMTQGGPVDPPAPQVDPVQMAFAEAPSDPSMQLADWVLTDLSRPGADQ